ncbi:MAG: integration host factor subunit alpha [Robiginitomaculum sp.]|jgi:integration host factor subunit alpha|nr:MAG: integration host factor subunit alpha [Robiginitomaculum sp.]
MKNKTLTRVDLTSAVVSEVGLSRQDSAEFVDTILNKISDALVRGESVKLSSFGAFHVRDKNQRMGRNPKTGEEVPISARRVVVFKASQVLKDRVDAHNNAK